MQIFLKIIKYTLILISVLMLIFLCAFFSLGLNRYSDKVTKIIQQNLLQAGWRSSFDHPEVALSGFKSKQTQAYSNKAGIFIDLENLQVWPKYSRLLFFDLDLGFSASAYDGSLSGAFSLANQQLNLLASNCQLQKHTQIAALGINGIFGMNIQNLVFKYKTPFQGKVNLVINNANKPSASSFSLKSFGLPIAFKIPSFENFNLDFDLQIENAKAQINRLALNSSLGQIQGLGSFQMATSTASKRINALNLQLRVELTLAGVSAFGDYLPLVSQGRLTNTDSKFKITIRDSGNGLLNFQFNKII